MGPDLKAELITNMQQILGEEIGMCGDGANDCAALKVADCGISLSETEASIAAPFTSKVQNITAARHLLREGRATLATAVQAFKFMMLYSMIQFFNVCILVPQSANLTQY